MIIHIAKKEIHHNLYIIRFPALLIISVILFSFNGILAVTEPAQKVPPLNPSARSVIVSRRHDRLQFCVRGNSADRLQSVEVMIGGRINSRTKDDPYQLPAGDSLARFALLHANHIDWMFIIKIVFSLFAIIFTFDAICRERQQGTLALMCSNPIPRASILLGKYLGAFGALMIPLMIGIILNLLIIYIMGGVTGTVSLQAEHWQRIGLLSLASIVYISLFIFLGLLVSTAAQRSSSSLLILLSFWVIMVIVLPNLAGVLVEHTSKIESEYQLSSRQRQVRELTVKELYNQIDSGKIRTQEELDEAAEEAFTRMIKLTNDIEAKHRGAFVAKRRKARRIAIVSPAVIYQYVAEAIADSGFERQQRFMKSVRDYYLSYEDYVRGKVGKIIPEGRQGVTISRNVDGKVLRASSPVPEEYEGDMSDFPYFSESPWSITDSLRISLNNLVILFLWNVLTFVTCHYLFVKRSIR